MKGETAMSGNPRSRAMRNRLKRGEMIIAPGAYDALTAMIIERAGFDAVSVTVSP